MSNFHPLGVVGRSSETQLQVGEHLSYLVLKISTGFPGGILEGGEESFRTITGSSSVRRGHGAVVKAG